MDGSVAIAADDLVDPPAHLYERLRQISGYTWDEARSPVHTSYDVWHVVGTRFVTPFSPSSASPYTSPGPASRLQSGRPSPSEPMPHIEAVAERSATSPTATAAEVHLVEEPVLARVSYHVLREERAFYIARSLISSSDLHCEHIVKPLDLVRLPPQPGDRGTILVAIYQHPGSNYLDKVLDMGPAFYWAHKDGDLYEARRRVGRELEDISLESFLNFAIGAAQCLEILHHGQGIIHGEIRGDAFHFSVETNKVRLISFGSGLRSFEHGLTSTGWSTLSKELGAKNKLLYISPEQTGRLPAEPDSRTDIYSLGVVLWTLLAKRPVFEGESPLDIVQGVLGRRIPIVSRLRMDVPDVLGRIIQRCTARNVMDRYYSASGLRYDLTRVQEFLATGDSVALQEWQIGSKDVSSFFMLPTTMIGRQQERSDIVKVIDRVAKSHVVHQRTAVNRFSDASSLHNECPDGADASSEGASSAEGATRQSASFSQAPSSDPRQSRSSLYPSLLSDAHTVSGDTLSQSSSHLTRATRAWDRHQSMSAETRSLVESVVERDSGRPGLADSPVSSLSRQLNNAKFRRRGHCEIVTIEGAAGLGKSFLMQSVLTEARRRGYCATAKFDTARRMAFGPLLKLLSSLFRQVWGERNTETPFHQALRQHIYPMWPTLHVMLSLPEFLLGAPAETAVGRSLSSVGCSRRQNSRSVLKRRGSSPGSGSPGPLPRTTSISSQTSQDYLRSGSSTKTMRLMNTFLDVLRLFTTHKFICFCLDDLHFADAESLELISQIICARMKMVIVITYRPDEMSPETVQSVIHPPESEDFPRAPGPTVTSIALSPLGEHDIVQFVATTLRRPPAEVSSLALHIQAKTAGNPFYIREMLSACYRRKCIWYDYRDSIWHYDLNRLFEQFQGEKDYDVLDTGFITRRLSELPPASRAILGWAALLGHSFSFSLICHLLSGEFQYHDKSYQESEQFRTAYSTEAAVAGLQAAIQAYILVPSETDDRFRFAHDRYIHAAEQLEGLNPKKMHFIIAQTLLKHYAMEPKLRDSTASHVCEAVGIIKERLRVRRPFRKLLFDCAHGAAENGARPTAAKYYTCAVALLQDDPWTLGDEDVSYDETLQLHLRAAECYLFMSNHELAQTLLDTVFERARTSLDKAPAFVLQSRILAQSGDAEAALASLKQCLVGLGVKFDDDPTWQKCDDGFERISARIQAMDRTDCLGVQASEDPALASIGAVLAETISAAWWSDDLRFYHLSLVMLDMHLRCGAFPQSGMAFMHLGIIALARFSMSQFAVDLGNIGLELLGRFRDPFSLARGHLIFPSFIGHAAYPINEMANQSENAIEIALTSGDRISTILSVGFSAQAKLFASENCADVEAFCQYACEEIPNWHQDTRGGTLIIATRQVCRALQGKTRTRNTTDIMSDQSHNAIAYKAWLRTHMQHGNRSILFYETLEMIPLLIYGHHDRAIEIGERRYPEVHLMWSMRNGRMLMLLYGLALAGRLLNQLQDPRVQPGGLQDEVAATITKIHEFRRKIAEWNSANNIHYMAWAKLLDAQVSELLGNHGLALRAYEEALDHASEHSLYFEEALGNLLMAGLFIRRPVRRSARACLRDSIGLYRQLGAIGVAEWIEDEHSLLLNKLTRHGRTADVGVQTEFAAETSSVQFHAAVDGADGDDISHHHNLHHHNNNNNINNINNININNINNNLHHQADSKGELIGAWRGSMSAQSQSGAGLPALDMIDLHAILVSSQVISSVLKVDELLKTMCDVILQTCGGSATMAALVVRDDGTETSSPGWSIAASGDSERGAMTHNPSLSLAGTSLLAENTVLYCIRFREPVFIADLISDERFSNVADAWLQRNPLSKSIIAIPICHGENAMLGVLYLEGEPGSFTDRNVTVLQLLVNQISISYSNAIAMSNAEKVSAENRAMVAVQKAALKKAREAESKAKDAESEAKRNAKAAEEATKAKSIFLANVSHELRTPLNGVIGNSELLRDSSLNKDQKEMADSIHVSAELLLAVINDILDFSRMEADKMTLFRDAFDPREMVNEVVRAASYSYSHRIKTPHKNVSISKVIDLPPLIIFGDPIRLHQVLGNLISNSLKFTEDGSITIGAQVESDTSETATLTFWVQDTGIGIPPEQVAKLFQPFAQANTSTTRRYGGSGLGLSICKSLIETMMKGEIRLESNEGHGTKAWFTVTFDKVDPDTENSPIPLSSHLDRYSMPSSPSDRHPSLAPSLDLTHVPKSQIRICIAEDNPINQKIAIQYVQRLGYTGVVAYENGLKAVEGLRHKAREGQPYHIILMDVQMPVLDGYEATKVIRQDPLDVVRKVLIIAMTASAIQGDREKCLAAGMNDYLAKPVRAEVLKKKLDAYMSPQIPESGPGVVDPSSLSLSLSSSSSSASSASSSSHTTTLADRNNPHVSRPLSTTAAAAAASHHDPALATAKHSTTPQADTPVAENAAHTKSSDRGSCTPSRTSSENNNSSSSSNNSNSKSLPDNPELAAHQAAAASGRRQPKKLTKSRGSSDASAERHRGFSDTLVDMPPASAEQGPSAAADKERSKGVLLKRMPHWKSMTHLRDAASKPGQENQ